MLEQTVQIVSNERDTDSYFRLVLRAPQIAPRIQPGQFAHVRVLPLKDALLRRPFSIFQVEGDTFSILYKTVGKGTEVLARIQAGEELSVIAPLGHGFTVPKRGGETPLLVAGGYGMAAMYLLAQRSPQKGIVFVGGRRRVDILCEKEFAIARLGRARDDRGRQPRRKRSCDQTVAGRTETQHGSTQVVCLRPDGNVEGRRQNRGGFQRAGGTFDGRAHVLWRRRLPDVRDSGQGRRRLGIPADLHGRSGI